MASAAAGTALLASTSPRRREILGQRRSLRGRPGSCSVGGWLNRRISFCTGALEAIRLLWAA